MTLRPMANATREGKTRPRVQRPVGLGERRLERTRTRTALPGPHAPRPGAQPPHAHGARGAVTLAVWIGMLESAPEFAYLFQ